MNDSMNNRQDYWRDLIDGKAACKCNDGFERAEILKMVYAEAGSEMSRELKHIVDDPLKSQEYNFVAMKRNKSYATAYLAMPHHVRYVFDASLILGTSLICADPDALMSMVFPEQEETS